MVENHYWMGGVCRLALVPKRKNMTYVRTHHHSLLNKHPKLQADF